MLTKIDNEIEYSGFKLLKNGIAPIGTPSFEEWQECWAFVGRADGAVRFWRGDLIRYAEHAYGEMYTQFINDTGKDYQTLRNDKSVADNVDLSRRRDKLSFSHHEEVAWLDPKDQDELLTLADRDNMNRNDFRKIVREYKNKKLIDNLPKEINLPDNINLINDDFRKVPIENNSIDLIITDPPYPSEFLPLWGDLSQLAERVLKPSGFLVAYSGQLHLPEVMQLLSKNMTYYWTFCLYHEGPTQLIMPRNLLCRWKPILIYQKPPFKKLEAVIQDYVISEKREKGDHEWQQSESGVRKLIETFSKPGDMLLDPFSGAGTFPMVAHELKRRVTGIEIDTTTYKLSQKRIHDTTSV